MPDRTHVIVTKEGETGFSLVSPQLPGFVMARPTEAELRDEYTRALRLEGVRGRVLSHMQIRGVSAVGQEFAIRWATDEHESDRREVATRMASILDTTETSSLEDHEPDDRGVVTYLCCVPGDNLGWVAEQLDPRGDVLVVVVSAAERMVFATEIAAGHLRDWPSISDHGWTFQTSLGEVMRQLQSHGAARVNV